MDVFVTRGNQRFVWDSDKARSNVVKHGITFFQATEIFFDPWLQYEDASVEDEVRDAAIGADASLTLLFVVHVLREDNMIRIVSAREAEGKERKLYEEHE